MAHKVLDAAEAEKLKEKMKQAPVRVLERVITKTRIALPSIVDSLVLLTIAFWYFFFTGLAILFRAPIPKEWLRISLYLSRGRIAKKVHDLKEAVTEKPKSKVRVLDLETQQPINIPEDGSPATVVTAGG